MKAIVYCRVSTAEQAAEGLSLDAQEARGRAWADAHGVEEVEVIADAGVSGTKALSERPGGAVIASLLESRVLPPTSSSSPVWTGSGVTPLRP